MKTKFTLNEHNVYIDCNEHIIKMPKGYKLEIQTVLMNILEMKL